MKTDIFKLINIIIFILVFAENECCETQYNVSVSFQVLNSDKTFKQFIKDCLNPVSLSNVNVEVIEVRDELIPYIPVNYVTELPNLENLTIKECGVQFIAVGAFKGVPKLKSVYIGFNSLSKILKGVFNPIQNLQVLTLTNGQIKHIDDGALQIPELKILYLDRNQLATWNPEWFKQSIKLEEIYMSNNNVTYIQKTAFDFFPNLFRIDFSENKISNVEPEAFKTVKNLDWLYLRSNRLTHLAPDIFPEEIHMNRFSVTTNLLNFLPQDLLNRLYVKYLDLDYNPWKCSCFNNINAWAETNDVTLLWDHCRLNKLPICVVAEPRCVESVFPEGTGRFLSSFRSLDFVQKNCTKTNIF